MSPCPGDVLTLSSGEGWAELLGGSDWAAGGPGWGKEVRLSTSCHPRLSFSPAQLQEHFCRVYVEGRCDEPLVSESCFTPPLPNLNTHPLPLPLIQPRDHPPRPPLLPPGSQAHTALLRDLAGYDPARAEFSLPPDPRAELLLSLLPSTPPSPLEQEDELDQSLTASLASCYRTRLEGRARTLHFVREHGLLGRRGPPGGGMGWGRLAQLLCATDLAFLGEGLRREQELRARVLRLQELRRKGVKLLGMAPVMKQLEQRRREHEAELQDGRRGAAPLDVLGLPGSERLSREERELSSQLRLPPHTFARLREALVEESARRGGLLLAEARPLCRIDVNKTRWAGSLILILTIILIPRPGGSLTSW